MGRKGLRRLRDGDYAFEPTEKINTRRVLCEGCGADIERKKAKRHHGKWLCPNCALDSEAL